jgi:hypothetical protein
MAVDHIWDMDADDLARENQWVDHFFTMCQDVYDVLVSKRGYEQDNFSLGYYYATTTTASHPSALDKPVTEKDLEKAVLTKVYRLLGANGGSEAVPQPQFMESGDYPRTTITPYA